jgi:hypothetical protein
MNVELEKLKAEIESDLRGIEEFFETALQSYNLSKPSSPATPTDGTTVTIDPIQENRKHYLDDYMMVFPSLLWRTLKKLERRLKQIDIARFNKCFEVIEPKFDRSSKSKIKLAYYYSKFLWWKMIHREKADCHYIGPKKFEIEEIREIRNYFLHNHTKPSSGLIEKYSYTRNIEIRLSKEKVYTFIEVFKNAKDTIFDPSF